MAGLVLRDLVNGRENPWAALYDPSRTLPAVAAVTEFVRGQADAVAQFVARMTPGQVKSVEDLEPGSGAVIGVAAGQVAAYRDETGALHERSAACTHAPCTVSFNSSERCWDCGCHGCRYGVDGAVLAGPATEPLAPVAA
jgi:Rieske Fe-S protein